MEKELISRIFKGKIAIGFNTLGEINSFLKSIKQLGGKWIGGREIEYDEKDLDSKKPRRKLIVLYSDYTIANLSFQCFHYGIYPYIDYFKLNKNSNVKIIERLPNGMFNK